MQTDILKTSGDETRKEKTGMTKQTGRLTLPTDADIVEETIRLKIFLEQMHCVTVTERRCRMRY